ncbi:AraC family transcriptional regulator [Saccharibacillus sacchari]|uniref:AraC family transcriptional regulator n=1 Tax=Saccharibacillus sacchari TaxID=456493 RepID=UPI0004B400B4|nr:AraC family transcriptional regulator [Saccharibacillus sacchari]
MSAIFGAPQHKELSRIIERYSQRDRSCETAIPSLFFYQHSSVSEPVYRVYNPSLCLIVQGTKQMLLAQERFEYGPANYMVASMNLPVIGQIIKAAPDAPYMSLKIEFTHNDILDVLKATELNLPQKENTRRALFIGQLETSLRDAVLRLARLLDTPDEIPFLAPLYKREILFRLLQGPYGPALGQLALDGSSSSRIKDAINRLIREWDKPFRVEELAEAANMSLSAFHRNFKEVTAMSPLQFQKQLRLQEARRILLSEAADAADVAFRTGYESASQFSREYARMFGAPPRTDINRLKEKYELKAE